MSITLALILAGVAAAIVGPYVLMIRSRQATYRKMAQALKAAYVSQGAFTTGKIMLKSDGSPWRPIVHIADISRAFIAVLKTPADLVRNEAFNIGSTSENYQIRQLAKIVGETVVDCELAFAQGAGPDKRNYRVNCDKALRVLRGFQPQWTARAGAKELHEAYAKYGLTLEEFEGPKFQRIAHIRQLLADGILDETLRYTTTVGSPS